MAEEEDDSSKTEEPTQHKLDEARKRGEVVTSREVNHLFMFIAAALFVFLMAGITGNTIGQGMYPFIAQAHDIPAGTEGEVGIALFEALKVVFYALAFPLLVFFFFAAAGTFLQIGPMWAPDHLEPKLERISLIAGIGRLFSKRSFVEFLKGLIKLTIVGVLVGALAAPILPGIEHLINASVLAMLAELKGVSLRIIVGAIALMIVIAIMDYLVQRLLFMEKMKMSRTELKEEFKKQEGDPQVKQRIRQIRMERARQRMMTDLISADVVVTNPEHYAVALKYDTSENIAPVVVAMGMDFVAQKIKEIAREHEIPIVENPPLARALYATADLGHAIPTEHYRAVAEVISYVFKLKGRTMPRPS